MFNIYIVMAIAPIPFSTFGNREFSNMGQNYIKHLCSVGLQAVLMQICFKIFEVLVATSLSGTGGSGNPLLDITLYFGYSFLLVGILWKTGAIASSILNSRN